MTKSIEIGNEFTPEGLAKLKKGQVLVYNMEGSRTELKITSINRKSHKLYVQETKLYTEDDIKGNEPWQTLGWEHHLKNMVVAEDPIEYLAENLD